MSKITYHDNSNWYELPTLVTQDPDLTLPSKLTYWLLWYFSRQYRDIDIVALASMRRVSRRQIFKDLESLEKHGYIKRTHTTTELVDVIGPAVANAYLKLDKVAVTKVADKFVKPVVEKERKVLQDKSCPFCYNTGKITVVDEDGKTQVDCTHCNK